MGHYRTTCPNLTKHHKRKDNEFYKINVISAKGRRAYIVWEEDDESSSSDSCSSLDDEFDNLYLMARNKSEDSQVYSSDLEDEPSYRELSKAFNEMYADSLNSFKKNSLQKKII